MEHQDYTRLYTKYKSKYTKAKYGQSGGQFGGKESINAKIYYKESTNQEVPLIKRTVDKTDEDNNLNPIEFISKKLDLTMRDINIEPDKIYVSKILKLFGTVRKIQDLKMTTPQTIKKELNDVMQNIYMTPDFLTIGKEKDDLEKKIVIHFDKGTIDSAMGVLEDFINKHRKKVIIFRIQYENPDDGEISNATDRYPLILGRHNPQFFQYDQPIDVDDDLRKIKLKILGRFLAESLSQLNCGLFCKTFSRNDNPIKKHPVEKELIDKIKGRGYNTMEGIIEFILGLCCVGQYNKYGVDQIVSFTKSYSHGKCKSSIDKNDIESNLCSIYSKDEKYLQKKPTIEEIRYISDIFKGGFDEGFITVLNATIDPSRLEELITNKLSK